MGIPVFFSELSKLTELQASPRVIAPSQRDQDRGRTLVLPRLFALLHWLLPPL